MHNVLIAPRKYVQGRGALTEAGKYLKILGRRPLVLWDSMVKDIVGETLLGSLAEEGIEPVDVDFRGDCTHKEVDRVIGIIRKSGADMAVGVGGGKNPQNGQTARDSS